MVFATMTAATAISIVTAAATGSGLYSWDAPVGDHLLVAGLSLGLPLMMFTRNLAFSLNGDTTIALLLYLEIALAFFWEFLFLGGGVPSPTQIVGALTIIIGSCTSVFLKARVEKGSTESPSAASLYQSLDESGGISIKDRKGILDDTQFSPQFTSTVASSPFLSPLKHEEGGLAEVSPQLTSF